MEERRRVARTEELLAIKELNGQSGAGSFVLDHSPAGAKLESHLSFIQGEMVSFSYQRPGEAGETHRWGRVVWVLPAPDKPDRFFLGVEFFLPVD
ncbi:MAG: PilZ domain-containing protein [Thermodesulfobacteriota bacterium]